MANPQKSTLELNQKLGHHSNKPSDNPLSENTLKADLLSLAEKDERLKPVISLLAAREQGVPHTDPVVKQTLKAFARDFPADPLPVDVQDITMVPFKEIPDPGNKLKIFAVQEKNQDLVPFYNWGKTQVYQPSNTLVVATIQGVCEVVKWAVKVGKNIRPSGFRHSWSSLYGEDNTVNVMFLPFTSLVELPYISPGEDWQSELSGITLVDTVAGKPPPEGHAFCKAGAGTTNADFREWAFKQNKKSWCLPFNVIMLEVTFGGTNAPICHGSGLSSSTLSDLVAEVVYVDAKGELQTVNDPAELRAASGAFGLLGLVVSVTILLDKMGVVNMMPVHTLLPLAIPPPKDYPLPAEVTEMIKKNNITPEQLEQARLDFIKRCEQNYYLEWFWFPYQGDAWVNTWQRRDVTDQDMHLHEYPETGGINGVISQEAQEYAAQLLTECSWFQWLSGRHQAYLFGAASMLALPNITDPKDAIVTYTSEALHFRRGIQSFRAWDMEWELPIPSRGIAQERDYEAIQRAWWDGISTMYSQPDAPVRVALEMRLTGTSNVILAPQRGNPQGTASIEFLTTLVTPEKDWQSVCQQVADKWASYKDEKGNLLNARPHWAKQWEGINVRGKPVQDYLKEDAYKSALPEFKEMFKKIVEIRGGTVDETRKVFGNTTMDWFIYE